MSSMGVALWTDEGERLSGLSMATAQGSAVKLHFVEGDPRKDCPFVGLRLTIFLEAATCYAQTLGKSELRVEPANEELIKLYEDAYGFRLVKGRRQAAYWCKGV